VASRSAEPVTVPFVAEDRISSLALHSSSPNDCRYASSTRTSFQAYLFLESPLTEVLPVQTVSRNEAAQSSIIEDQTVSYLQRLPCSNPTSLQPATAKPSGSPSHPSASPLSNASAPSAGATAHSGRIINQMKSTLKAMQQRRTCGEIRL
jgi:hypothetical protein